MSRKSRLRSTWGAGNSPCLQHRRWSHWQKRSVVEGLEPGQGTVGTKMELSHLSATPIGMTVRCETELVEIDRRKLVFSIQAFDEVEKIAEGRHERFIINEESFLEKANAKGFVTPAE